MLRLRWGCPNWWLNPTIERSNSIPNGRTVSIRRPTAGLWLVCANHFHSAKHSARIRFDAQSNCRHISFPHSNHCRQLGSLCWLCHWSILFRHHLWLLSTRWAILIASNCCCSHLAKNTDLYRSCCNLRMPTLQNDIIESVYPSIR